MDFSPAFGLYCLEQDGLLDTNESRYHCALNLLKQGYTLEEAIVQSGINIDTLAYFQIEELNKYGGEFL